MESLEVCLKLQEELKVLLFDGSDLKKDDVSLFNFISSLENPKDVLDFSNKFKEEGNSSFKGGDVDEALEKYGLSCVFLSCLVLDGDGIRGSFMQLATSVVLNMAVSLLKKKEYKQVGHLCSIILNYNPNNTKALFRRASAAIGLGKFELASWDLRLAHEVDPNNKEVSSKLREVEESIHVSSVKSKGKRKAKQLEGEPEKPPNDQVEKLVDPNLTKSKRINCSNRGQVGTLDSEGMEQLDGKEVDHEVAMEPERIDKSMDEEEDHMSRNNATKDGKMSARVVDIGSRRKESGNILDEEKENFCFRNKKKAGTALVISKKDYHLLVKGRLVQHFNPKSGITMSIRVIGAPHETKKSHTQFPSQSSLMQQGKPNYHEESAAHGTGTTKMEISPSESDKVENPIEDTPALPKNPSHISSPKQNPNFLQTSTTGSCSFPFQSITMGNRSPFRRARFQTPKQGVKKQNRGSNRKHSCVFTNQGFYRCKVAVRASNSDHHLPSSQNYTDYRIGEKRKLVFLQSPDLPNQPRKFIIRFNGCYCHSNSVCSLLKHAVFGSSPPSRVCNVTVTDNNEKLAKTSAIG